MTVQTPADTAAAEQHPLVAPRTGKALPPTPEDAPSELIDLLHNLQGPADTRHEEKAAPNAPVRAPFELGAFLEQSNSSRARNAPQESPVDALQQGEAIPVDNDSADTWTWQPPRHQVWNADEPQHHRAGGGFVGSLYVEHPSISDYSTCAGQQSYPYPQHQQHPSANPSSLQQEKGCMDNISGSVRSRVPGSPGGPTVNKSADITKLTADFKNLIIGPQNSPQHQSSIAQQPARASSAALMQGNQAPLSIVGTDTPTGSHVLSGSGESSTAVEQTRLQPAYPVCRRTSDYQSRYAWDGQQHVFQPPSLGYAAQPDPSRYFGLAPAVAQQDQPPQAVGHGLSGAKSLTASSDQVAPYNDHKPFLSSAPRPSKRQGRKGVPPVPVPQPTAEYFIQASKQPTRLPGAQQILIVMDLNGTLVHRSKLSRSNSFKTAIHERPYVKTFLNYVLAHFHVMVWSSAQARNVNEMCSKLFSNQQRRHLKAIWARDKLDLTGLQFNHKVQVYKKLSKVWELAKDEAWHPNAQFGGYFGQHNTILLDDSKEKARSEPFNLLQVPEWTRQPEKGTNMALQQVVRYLEHLRFTDDVSGYIRETPFVYVWHPEAERATPSPTAVSDRPMAAKAAGRQARAAGRRAKDASHKAKAASKETNE